MSVLLIASPLVGHSASFDCSKAKGYVERVVCSDPELSELDDALAAAFDWAKADALDASEVTREQRAWLVQRNACSEPSCIKTAYETRLEHLGQSRVLYSILGTWESGGRANSNTALTVTRSTITLGQCENVPYDVIRDRIRTVGDKEIKDIAVQLKPRTQKQNVCVEAGYSILEFSMPSPLICHAEISMYRSRAEFDSQRVASSGVWGCRR